MAARAVTADGRARVLADGKEIPLLGLGVWQVPHGPETEKAVRWALELGYCHVDTAQAHGNEESVGRAGWNVRRNAAMRARSASRITRERARRWGVRRRRCCCAGACSGIWSSSRSRRTATESRRTLRSSTSRCPTRTWTLDALDETRGTERAERPRR